MELVQIAQNEHIAVSVMEAGKCIVEGDLQLKCIQPFSGDSNLSGNEGSMVLSICFQEFSMLCTGDVEANGEEILTTRLSGQEFTVLKVAHHGSKNSRSERFLKAIQPRIALLSAGADNSYGHPHHETLERLKAIGSNVFLTTKNGAITLQTDGNTLTIDRFLY